MPDLVALVRRDGLVLQCGGGTALQELRLQPDRVGQRIPELWPAPVAELLQQLIRRAIALRESVDARCEHQGRSYELRAIPQGPDRVLCVLRAMGAREAVEPPDGAAERPRPQLDRRGFMRRFKDALSTAALRETPLALAIIQIDGLTDVTQVIDASIAEQLASAAIVRLAGQLAGSGIERAPWFMGQLSDTLLALVLETADREAIDACVSDLCVRLRAPIAIGDIEFHLTPYAGVALLGRDARSPRVLIDRARAAVTQARRAGSRTVQYFTDTLRLRSLARLDLARELRDGIDRGEVRLRYVGRHDLLSGSLVDWLAYVYWTHPVRGEVPPHEFLRLAETTGMADALSRSLLHCLQEDLRQLLPHWPSAGRVSFGALRHHLIGDSFVAEIQRLLESGAVPASRLELRIAEQTFIGRPGADWSPLQRLGVRLVIDEFGRGLSSLAGLARVPIWGLQLDRAWVQALRADPVAMRVCRASVAMAGGLGVHAMAPGVDDASQRQALLRLGVRYGSGDLYSDALPDVLQPYHKTGTG